MGSAVLAAADPHSAPPPHDKHTEMDRPTLTLIWNKRWTRGPRATWPYTVTREYLFRRVRYEDGAYFCVFCDGSLYPPGRRNDKYTRTAFAGVGYLQYD